MSENCKSITVYPRYDEEAMEVDDLSRDHTRSESLLTNLGLSVLKRTESLRDSETNVSQQLGGDELIKEKLRLIGMFSKDEEEHWSFNTGFPQEILGVESRKRFESLRDSVCFTSDEIPLSYCMKKIINRNNLYQELLDDRNARFWYSIYYIKNGII